MNILVKIILRLSWHVFQQEENKQEDKKDKKVEEEEEEKEELENVDEYVSIEEEEVVAEDHKHPQTRSSKGSFICMGGGQ